MKATLGQVLAYAAAALATTSTTSTIICMTGSGTKSVSPVPTRTDSTRRTSTKTVTVISHPTKTVTTTASTSTVTDTTTTVTTTTLPTSTDTISTTTFTTVTSTTEAPVVTVTDTSSTSTISTSTVGPFFTGVQDTLPGVDAYSGPSKRDLNEREAVEDSKLSQPRRNMLLARKPKPSKTMYPTAVTCSDIIKIIPTKTTTKKGTTVTTVFTPPPSTSTTVTTITDTSTDAPSASTTVTDTETIVSTETDTSTSTTTTTTTSTVTTIVQATNTVACDSTNYASSVGGINIINATPETNGEDFYGLSANTLDSCCAACAANPSCGAFSFLTSNSQCQNAVTSGAGTCPVNGDGFQALLANGNRNTPVVVGNGICGEFDSSQT